MTAPIAQNRDGASSVIAGSFLGRRIALTLRRVVVFLSEITELVARVVCEFDSLAGDVHASSAASAQLEATSRLARELAELSSAANELLLSSHAEAPQLESLAATVEAKISALTTTLLVVSPLAFGELKSTLAATLPGDSLLDSQAAHESPATVSVTLPSRADCECSCS